jgi:hypothetical protein
VTSKTWWFIGEMWFKVFTSTISTYVFTTSSRLLSISNVLWCELFVFWPTLCLNSLLVGSNLLHFFHKLRCPSQWPRSWMVLARITLLEHLQL